MMNNYKLLFNNFKKNYMIKIKCIHGKFKGLNGCVNMSNNLKPIVYIGNENGTDDHTTSVKDFNDNYIVVGISKP